ncbi:MAG TPA: type II secretion system F family protein [Rhodothermales bacterium]|nr:type II secretion system F family protein [Rhodothermales bacterium]
MSGNAWSERTARDLAQAGWGLKVSEYFLIRLFAAVGLGFGSLLLMGTGAGSVLVALVLGGVGFMLPALVLHYYRSKRQRAITAQLAEMLSLLSNSLRSGFAFTQSVELAVKQLDAPITDELARFLHDISLGAPTDAALQAMADRSGSYDLDMMVSSIMIQRNTGGNLSEILDNVADTIRERERLQGEIRALTSSQRFTGMVLSVYPIALGLLFFALAPETWKILFESELGRILLVSAAGLQIMGMVTIRRILALEV